MLAERLSPGDTIGVICPSHIADESYYRQIAKTLEYLGFRVKFGANVYKNTHGYLASPEERADDLNAMVADNDVKMILFGGGWGANELLPLIDYESIIEHPTLFSSYSDGTSILDAIYAATGLITYYGQGTDAFHALLQYDYAQFTAHFIKGNTPESLRGEGDWHVLHGGAADGVLIGGYMMNFAWLLGGEYFRYDPARKYILFLEDHEKFSSPAYIGACLSHIEQSPFIGSVGALIFGRYSGDPPADLLARLARFGEKHGVPTVYCDAFGHYGRHAILPVGADAALDAHAQTLEL